MLRDNCLPYQTGIGMDGSARFAMIRAGKGQLSFFVPLSTKSARFGVKTVKHRSRPESRTTERTSKTEHDDRGTVVLKRKHVQAGCPWLRRAVDLPKVE